MKAHVLTRRQFIAAASASSLAAVASTTLPAYGEITRNSGKLAILGGEPIRKNKAWPPWPHIDEKIVEAVVKTTKSGIWCRIQSATGTVATFEKEYAKLLDAKFCVATGSGTQALHTCVEALGIGAGDEVITSLGCFSFQTTKTIACGEGGAIVGDDEALMDKCYTVHNHGTSRQGRTEVIGPKYRMNEFEAAVLLAQLAGAQERFRRRNENAAHLTARLKGCPDVVPQKLYEGTASSAFYHYAMSYKKEHFHGLDRGRFLKAVEAEGVSLSPYIERGLHREPWIAHIVKTKAYQKTFSARRLQQWRDEMSCPNCDRVCEEIAMIWASGPLLGTRADMDDIADAILKVYENRAQLS